MQIRLLGPVDIDTGDGRLEIPGVRRKAILTVLALHAGRIVSTGRLIDVVWGDRSPATGVNTVQSHVSGLRRALGAKSAILARAPGYVLNLHGEPTDVTVAERLVRAGRNAADPVRGAELLRSALSLWRGRPLMDVEGVPWLAEQAERLAGLQLDAQRSLIDLRLQLGEHHQVLPELTCLAGSYPLDEHVRGQLVLALYRAGRQADALAALRALRELLAMDLGIDPVRQLRELELAILRQDAELDVAPVPAQGWRARQCS